MTFIDIKRFAALLFGLTVPLAAQQGTASFLSVKAWQGAIQLTSSDKGSVTSMFGTEEWSTSFQADLQLRLDQYDREGQFWTGAVSGKVSIQHKLVHTMPDGCVATHTAEANGSPDTSITDFGMLHIASGQYWFNPLATTVRGRRLTTIVCPKSSATVVEGESGEQWWPVGDRTFTTHLPLPVSGMLLEGEVDTKLAFPLTVFGYAMTGTADPQLAAKLRWKFQPAGMSEDEVLVTIPGYAAWRPEAGLAGGRGNSLTLKAELRSKEGGVPAAKAVRFEWEFPQMSREPGYALNAPVADPGREPDMRFEPGTSLLVEDPDGQTGVTPDGEYLTSAATVVSMDWGGFGTLRVTAVLEDGRRITGHLEGDANATAILLPKRQPGDLIAEAWRKQKGVEGSDTADDEEYPAGDGNKGDGLTLYEEYRGFVEGGKHIEGNPKKKDYFVVNLAGDAYVPGILLFQDESGLDVHYQFDSFEFPASRIINANHGATPHRVDQHGVVIVAVNPDRTYAQAESDTNAPDTPAHIQRITTPRLLGSASAKLRQYLWAGLAHELFHACNVWHHGDEGDREVVWRRKDGTDDVWLEQDAEGTGPVKEVRVQYENGRMYSPITPATGRKVYIGAEHGLHSGHDGCVMRYDVAQAYVSKKDPLLRYRVQEEPGFLLCATAAGTGVNESGRTPESRYGTTAAHRGDCIHQILVNDAVKAPRR